MGWPPIGTATTPCGWRFGGVGNRRGSWHRGDHATTRCYPPDGRGKRRSVVELGFCVAAFPEAVCSSGPTVMTTSCAGKAPFRSAESRSDLLMPASFHLAGWCADWRIPDGCSKPGVPMISQLGVCFGRFSTGGELSTGRVEIEWNRHAWRQIGLIPVGRRPVALGVGRGGGDQGHGTTPPTRIAIHTRAPGVGGQPMSLGSPPSRLTRSRETWGVERVSTPTPRH